jgi:large repetitive protein
MTLSKPRRVFLMFAVCLLMPVTAAAQKLVTGAGRGTPPAVRVLDASGTDQTFFAYDPKFLGGVRVALADVNGDGVPDIITAAGPGAGPHVRVWNGTDLSEIGGFFAYDPTFAGGVFVATGDVNGDGRADIITGAGAGGSPHVRVWDAATFTEIAGFNAYDPAFHGGVTVAAGDVDGDGVADIVTGAGPGGGPHVRVWHGASRTELGGFYAYDPSFQGGVNVAAGDIDGDGLADILTGAGSGGAPLVRAWSGADFAAIGDGFVAYEAGFSDGITVGTVDLDRDGVNEIVTGPMTGSPLVRVWTQRGRSTRFTLRSEYFSFDPGAGPGGTFVASASDSDANGNLRFVSATETTFAVGSPGTFTVRTRGGPKPALTVSGTLPAGVTFVDNGNRTATLAGTPAAGTDGTYPLVFTADNGLGAPVTQNFTLIVGQGPTITSANATTFTIGVAGTFTVTTTGTPAPAITATGALPSAVTFTDNGNGTATLAGTPAAGTAGTYPLTITATNSDGSATQNFILTVESGNAPPSITSANTTTFTANTPGTFTVTAVGTPTPALAVSGSLPAGVTFVDNGNGTGTLSGTPAAGTGGSYALTFTASNGVLPDATQAFTLNVNQSPAITSAASTTFTVGAAGSFTVTTSGFPLPTLARGGVALPAGVTFVDNGNGTGTLSGTPSAGTGGTYAITFTATNTAGASAPQAFTLTVNQAPAITSANTANFTVGQAGTFTVTTTGFPTATITRTGVALPTGVTFVDNGNGTATLSGTPAAGTAGAYAFTLTAANGVTPDATQSFTLNVNAPPAITSANTATFTVGTASSFTVTTTGFPTPTVSQTGALPTGVTFTPATKVLAGTATQTGAFPLVFTATNGVPPDATQNFTLNVVCPPITVNPATMPDGLFQVAYAGVTFTQTGSTGSTITWSAIGLPAGLSIAPTTGVVSGTPTNTVLNAAVIITATDNFGCQGTRPTTITVRPTTDNENYVNGVGNTQFVVGVAPAPPTPHVFVNDNVKMGDLGPAPLSVAFNAAANGTVVEGATDGTFIYTPNVAFAGPTDSFTYTLTDGNGVTNTGTVTINLSGLVWYVNSSGGNGDGRSHNPFNTLASASTASGAGSIIYVHTGGATTPGNLTMDANQSLFGQGAPFNLNGPTGLTIAAGTRPTLSGTVTLANNDTVTAVNFAPVGIPAMTASAVTGPVGIDQVNVTGGTNALSLTNVSGAVTVTNATFTNTSGAEVLINQGTGNVSVAATISGNAGRLIDIQNRTGGAVTFTGALTDTGTGILLNNNGTSTFSFSGGMTLNGAGTTFTATNPSLAGTLTITGTNTIGATTPPTSGTALNVTNINIGASGLTFRNISAGTGAGGPVNGIVLSSTGATGSLSVTGTGSASSGGVIQFTTGAGISLTNTLHPQFAWMNIHDIGQNGIDGQQVTNFTLTNSTINNVGTAAAGQYNETNIAFNDAGAFTSSSVSGTVTITNNTLTNARRHGIQIENGTGTIANLTISNNVLTSSTSAAASLGTAILVLAQGSATLNAHVATGTIASNTITNFPSGEGIFIGGGAGNVANNNSSTLGANGTPISITGNAISGQAAAGQHLGSNAIRASFNGQVGVANFSITNNGTAASPITNIEGQGISVFMGGSVTGTTTINNNFIVANQTLAAGTQGLAVQIDDGPAASGTSAADYNVVITNNSVSAYEGNGIRAIARASLGKMDVTIQNNTVGTPILGNRNGIRIDSGSAVGDVTVCLAISGNTSDGSGVNAGLGLRKQGTVATVNDFGIVGLSPSPTTGANAAARVNTDNPAGGGVDIISGDNFTSCTITP